ncbi:(Fe-S)-binding protein [Pedobacter insulae]|uniref:L-lactate dehydrogenase complex protein LldE n=1 Tax=Pedobacter insulae TaxID=414048 RepID=A0A1I2UX54_9SPHI|nr:(Fe-S)-binding protein [Pedobacter insulae]SFG80789.1 L-lactate dehydrogenase complex protein LldE [Pedobacter insulae]
MKVALFIPCYIDQFYPQVAIACLELLERLGIDVSYPLGQTCCGQPMANSGFEHLADGCNTLFVKNFIGFDYIVAPSGSCVLHIKEHLKNDSQLDLVKHIKATTYELTSFLVDILKVEHLTSSFPYRVGMHQSCHGQRGLKLSQMSELNAPEFSKPGKLLSLVKDIELVELDRKDECCGFGGTFCVAEEAVSVKMGKDRINDHTKQDVEYITGVDMSCLMHLEGILNRQNSSISVKHIAEILNGVKA